MELYVGGDVWPEPSLRLWLMTCLTLKDLHAFGLMLEVECVCCGEREYRSAASVDAAATTAVGALGLGLDCRWCGSKACITSPALELDVGAAS